MVKRGLIGLMVVALGWGLVGCRSMRTEGAAGEQTAKIRIKALIDGADTIHIQGNRVWYKHHAYQLPGLSDGLNEPTIINGREWRPNWVGDESSVFEELDPPLPPDARVTVERVRGRGRIFWEQPSPENNGTLKITIDDRGPNAAAWYVLDIDW